MNPHLRTVYLKWGLLLIASTLAVYWLTPIYLGVFLAFTMMPILNRQKNRRFPKLTLLFGASVFIVCGYLVSTLLYRSAETFLPNVHVIVENVLAYSNLFTPSLSLQLVAEEMLSLETLIGSLTHSSSILMDVLLFLLIFSSASFQFYHQPDWYVKAIPHTKRSRYQQTIYRMQKMSGLFFRNELILFSFTWFATTLFAWLLHMPQPIFIGFLVALADLIPFIGISLFYIPFSAYGFVTEQWIVGTLTLVMFVFVVISRQLLEPFLWKQTIRVPTFLLLVSLTSLVVILGMKGLLLLPLLFIAYSELTIKNA